MTDEWWCFITQPVRGKLIPSDFDPKPRRQQRLLGSLQERVCYWHCFCRLGLWVAIWRVASFAISTCLS